MLKVSSMIKDWQRLRHLIGPQSWTRFVRSYTFTTVAAVLETASIAAVFPLVAVIVKAQDSTVTPWFGTVWAMVLLALLYVAGLGLRVLAVRQSANTNMAEGYGFSARLFERALHQPYEWNFSHHSADLRAAILSDAQDLISYVFIPLGRVIAQSFLLAAVTCVLLVIQPVATVVFGTAIVLTYTAVLALMRNPLSDGIKRQIVAHSRRQRLSGEAFSANREVRLSRLENRFATEFALSCDDLARASTDRSVLTEMPKLALEAVIFALLAWFVLMSATDDALELQDKLPTIAVFAAAGLKLFPMGHQVFVSLSLLRSGWPLVSRFEGLLSGFHAPTADLPCPPMTASLALENVSFHYPGNVGPAVRNVSFVARPGQKVAITGRSGSGKSTLIDVVAGLINPSEGQILIDGNLRLPSQFRSWQNQLRYCPQSPSLFDLSIADNITIGVEYPPERIRSAAHLACLDELLTARPLALDAMVGEKGRNLSGGQVKRIGIARALLDEVAIYILDEPTSNLDASTAALMISRVFAARPNAIFFIVTHDKVLADQCDIVVDLSVGADIRSE